MSLYEISHIGTDLFLEPQLILKPFTLCMKFHLVDLDVFYSQTCSFSLSTIHCYDFFIYLKLKIMLYRYWILLQICVCLPFQIAISLEIANRVRDLLNFCLHGRCIFVIISLYEISHNGPSYLFVRTAARIFFNCLKFRKFDFDILQVDMQFWFIRYPLYDCSYIWKLNINLYV